MSHPQQQTQPRRGQNASEGMASGKNTPDGRKFTEMQNNRQIGQVYEPAEDSQLLASAVEKYASGSVLDMGAGSGIQAITAAKKTGVKSVVAADVNDDALKHAAAAAEKEKVASRIAFVKS